MEFEEINNILDKSSFPSNAILKDEINQFENIFMDDNFKSRYFPNFSTFKEFIDTLKTEYETNGMNDMSLPAFKELNQALNQITEVRSWAQYGMNQPFNYLLSREFLNNDINISTFLYFIAYCFKELNYSKQFLDWCSATILHAQWTGIPSLRNYTIDRCFSAYKKKTISLHNHRSFLAIDRFSNLKIFTYSGKIKTIEKNSYSIKKDQIFVGDTIYQLSSPIFGDNRYENRIKTGFIGSFYFDKKDYSKQIFPKDILDSFCESLTCPDFYLLRSILSIDKIQSNDINEFASDLISIFSIANKMNAFLRIMTYLNFASSDSGEQTILRSNSLLSAICSYFSQNYGDHYLDKVMKDVIMKVDEVGQINYKKPDEEESTKIFELLCYSIDVFSSSLKLIPIQLKHLAYILLTASNAYFTSKRTAYNVVNSFIFLRFITKNLVTPEQYQDEVKLANDPFTTIIPFAQMLQKVFSLTIPNNLKLNDSQLEIMKTKMKSLIDFAFKLESKEPKAALYPLISCDDYYSSANRIMRIFATNYEQILKEYHRLTSDRTLSEPTSIFMSEVIQHCFQEA